MITVQIIIQNDEQHIESCIKSLMRYNDLFKFDIINAGSTDKTLEICNDYKLHITHIENIKDYSKARNDNLKKFKNDFLMYLHPYEKLIYDENFINILKNKTSYLFKVVQGTVLTKEVRLWNSKSIRFENPVYEKLNEKQGIQTNFVIASNITNYRINNSKMIINEWKKREPLKYEPYYYEAFELLKEKDYLNFKNVAEHYLFLDKNSKSSIIMRYYLSLIELHCFNDINSANSNVIKCILKKPLMAEFWCLLGDIFYKINDFQRAIEFYDNAIILGSQRKENDDYPLDIVKYKEYPNNMLKKLKNNI